LANPLVVVVDPSGSLKSADRKNAISTMKSEADEFEEHPDAPPPDSEPAKIG
jgi:streptogramin lyase